MLEMKDVTKTFGSFKALDCLSLNVPKGAVYGLVGPNGAGKTTAIRHLTGVYRPDSGSVTLEGAPIDENLAAKERICCVADEPFYFPGASLEEMKNFYAGLYPKFDGKRFDELQDVFRLRRKAPLRRFSKGMQKQACFHLALCTHADVLILDEPTGAPPFWCPLTTCGSWRTSATTWALCATGKCWWKRVWRICRAPR